MSKEDRSGLNRRQMLKGSAAGALVAFGGTTAASAKQDVGLTKAEEEAIVKEYKDAAMVREVVHEQTDLLEELEADDVLDEQTVGDLEELSEPSDNVGEHVTAYRHGHRHTPRIKIFREVDAGFLSISVFPEEDTAHATLNPVESGEPLGKDHLVKYGSMPEPDPDGCVDPGHCQDCSDCSEECCSRDPQGDCTQWCTQCDCRCVCCDCGVLCSSYC